MKSHRNNAAVQSVAEPFTLRLRLEKQDVRIVLDAVIRARRPPIDEVAEFDALVEDAVSGDRRAIGAIAIALCGTIYDLANDVVGPDRTKEASDVFEAFFDGLCEKRFTFPRIRGAGLPWIERTVQQLARDRLRQSLPPYDNAA